MRRVKRAVARRLLKKEGHLDMTYITIINSHIVLYKMNTIVNIFIIIHGHYYDIHTLYIILVTFAHTTS